MSEQNISCSYFFSFNQYTCVLANCIIEKNTSYRICGKHLKNKSNDDITVVKFKNCQLNRFPSKLPMIFINLKYLCIDNSNIMSVSRSDLEHYTSLEKLMLIRNLISYMPADIFSDTKKLTNVKLIDNEIQFIDPAIFKSLKKPMIVQFNEAIYNSFKHTNWESINGALHESYDNSPWRDIFAERKIKDRIIRELLGDKDFLLHLMEATEDEHLKDFTITVEDEEFKVHKLILAARSTVLADMIKDNPALDQLTLVDVTPKVFRSIRYFIYTNQYGFFDDDFDFKQLLIACEKLGIKTLSNFAAKQLVNQVTAENALELLTLGDKYNHKQLQEKAFSLYKKTRNSKNSCLNRYSEYAY